MMMVDNDESWATRALCATDEPDSLFVKGTPQRQVRMRCLGCEVRIECLADALQSEANYGVWGALTERERRAMLRKYSNVRDWKKWILESPDPLACEIREAKVGNVLQLARA